MATKTRDNPPGGPAGIEHTRSGVRVRTERPVDTQPSPDAVELDSFEYVTGEVPYLSQEEILLDQERAENRSKDGRDQEAPEEVVADRVAFDERDDVNTSDDVDRQGRRGQEERDWWGDMYADSGRGRPNDGSSRRRR